MQSEFELDISCAHDAPLQQVSHSLQLTLRAASSQLVRENKIGIIIIDAIDRLEDMDAFGMVAFSWIKRPMPLNINLVISFADVGIEWLKYVWDPAPDHAKIVAFHVPVPSAPDGVEMISRMLRRHQVPSPLPPLSKGQR